MRLTVEKLVYGGDGLARLPADEHGRGKALFLPFVLPGEEVEGHIVEEKPGFGRGHADEIILASPQRTTPHCPYFGRCGGCHYQHTTYENQLEIKAAILKENLRRIAKLDLAVELAVHPSNPWNYRNRTRLKLQTAPEFALGYYKLGSHELLPVRECPISSALIEQAISELWELGTGGKLPAEAREIELFVNEDDSQLLIETYCSPGIDTESATGLAEQLKTALPGAVGAVIFKGPGERSQAAGVSKKIGASGQDALTYRTAQGTSRVSAGAFFQTNRFLIDKLAEIVTAGASGGLALDLYAGVGLFSTILARSFAQVIAVEASQISHSDLAYNSPGNVKAVCATTEHYLKSKEEPERPDLVVVDPPRSGLGDRLSRELASLQAPAITYVSCDPATLARDLRPLLEGGYRIEQAHLVDLFPQTFHLESVFRLVL